jgi:hypothetical protein
MRHSLCQLYSRAGIHKHLGSSRLINCFSTLVGANRVAILIILVLYSSVGRIQAQSPAAKTTQQALQDRFDFFRTTACGISQWFTVPQKKALTDPAKIDKNDKDKQSLTSIPQLVSTIFASDLNTNIALAKDLTINSVLEKVYTVQETKNQSGGAFDNSTLVLGDSTAVIPTVDQIVGNKPLLVYSHSCNYLLSYAMNASVGFSLPLATLKAAFDTSSKTAKSASIVMVGGSFPSRFAALYEDTGANNLYANSSLWDWYSKHSDVKDQQLYYRRFARGIAEFTQLSDNGQYNTTISASGSVSPFFASIKGNVQAAIQSQEQQAGSLPHVTIIQTPDSEHEFGQLPTPAQILKTIKSATTRLSPDSSGQAKFDNKNTFQINQQITGLWPAVCTRSWEFKAADGSMMKVGKVTATSTTPASSVLPLCFFSFPVTSQAPADSSAVSLSLTGEFTTSDDTLGLLELPATKMDIYLSHKATPSLIQAAPLPQVNPTTWKTTSPDHYDLIYQMTVSFDDPDSSVSWLSNDKFSAINGKMTCDDKSEAALAPSDLSVDATGKSVSLKMARRVYTTVSLDLYSAQGKQGHACSISFTLRAPDAAGALNPFPVDSSKIGGGVSLFFPKELVKPTITVVLPQPSLAGDGILPNGVVGAEYAGAKFLASGGVAPYIWKLAGDPPPGLTVSLKDGLGVLSGSPSAAKNYTFVVEATDSAGVQPDGTGGDPQTGQKTLSITVETPLGITTDSLPQGTVASVYPPTALMASGGIAPYKFDLAPTAGLPEGLVLSADGKISGTPTKDGTVYFGIRITDASNPPKTATKPFSITVNK